MKLAPLILLIIVTSCNSGLSRKEKESLEVDLQLQRFNAALNYKLAAIDAQANARIKYYDYEKKDTLIKLTLQQFESNWNEPYDIKKDSTLTLNQYLKYCKANGYDPVQYIDVLRERAPSKY